jgi:hypothetical protein
MLSNVIAAKGGEEVVVRDALSQFVFYEDRVADYGTALIKPPLRL